MSYIRTTITLDEALAKKLRQNYKNLSQGINEVVREHLFEEKGESMFGALKGTSSKRAMLKTLKEIEKEEEKEDTIYGLRR